MCKSSTFTNEIPRAPGGSAVEVRILTGPVRLPIAFSFVQGPTHEDVIHQGLYPGTWVYYIGADCSSDPM